MDGYRGHLMLSKAKSKIKEDTSNIVYKCFKCKFFVTNQTLFNKHLTLMHMMGMKSYLKMQRMIALSTPNLLMSTFHETKSEAGESLRSLTNAKTTKAKSVESEKESQNSGASEISGVNSIQESEPENVPEHDKSDDHTSLTRRPQPSFANSVSDDQSKGICPGFTSTEITRDNEYSTANNVTNSPKENVIERVTSTQSIGNTKQRMTSLSAETAISFSPAIGIQTNTLLENPNLELSLNAQNVTLSQRANSNHGYIEPENIRITRSKSRSLRSSSSVESVRNGPAMNVCQRITTTQSTRVQSFLSAENVTNFSNMRDDQAITVAGDMSQNKNRRKIDVGKNNLSKGTRNKRIKNVNEIGQFNTKYKAHDRTKQLLTKHAKQAAEHFLKLNNTKAGGIDQAENGFFMVFKAGKNVYIANEGIVGKKFIEDEKYRETLIEEGKNIDMKMNTPMLTSFLKSQYGASQSQGQNTPKSQKRKNYRGVGGQNKRPSIPAEEVVENTVVADNIDIDHQRQRQLQKKKKNPDSSEKSSINSEKTTSTAEGSEDSNNQSEWLKKMIATVTEPSPINSKPPRKEARQLHPFNCSECGTKYKLKQNYIKYLRQKHNLV